MVVMLLPLKQGLKPSDTTGAQRVIYCCYATSIKTRIETLKPCVKGASHHSCYATSIKTRIETHSEMATTN